MIRSRTALVAVALAAIGVAGCGGSKATTEGDIRGDVQDGLIDHGYVAAGSDPADAIPVEANDAEDIGVCVARAMFESSDEWTPAERDAVDDASDGDEPDPDLVDKFEALVASCFDEVVGEGGADEEQTAAEDDEDDETTTTTSADEDEETTTTEG